MKNATKSSKSAIALFLIFISNIIWHLEKAAIIFYSSVNIWRTISTKLLFLLIAEGVVLGIQYYKEKTEEAEEDLLKREETLLEDLEKAEKQRKNENIKNGNLPMKESLNTDSFIDILRKILCESNRNWNGLEPKIKRCIGQLQLMNSYQNRIYQLLQEDDTQRLENIKDVVEQVKQCMLRNAKKVCDCIQTYNSSNLIGYMKAEKQAEICIRDNNNKIDQIPELMSAIADFLNNQGQYNAVLTAANKLLNAIEDTPNAKVIILVLSNDETNRRYILAESENVVKQLRKYR